MCPRLQSSSRKNEHLVQQRHTHHPSEAGARGVRDCLWRQHSIFHSGIRMSSLPPSSLPERSPHRPLGDDTDDTIDLRDLFCRLARGLSQTIGLVLLGIAVAAVASFLLNRVQSVATSTRVVFSFPGFERGQYPDRSKFQSDDLRAPSVISEALRRQSLDTSSEFQSKVRGGLSVEGLVPANVVKERDKMRAAGQTPPPYVPDEYFVALSLDRSFPLTATQREKLLQEIVSVYRENFNRTYGHTPVAFGTAFETLRDADFPEYEIIFNSEINNIKAYLGEQIGHDGSAAQSAASFRSSTTNFSFKDLLEQTDLFAQIQLNETLGLIHENGLSRNRATAMLKMNYYLRQLEDRETQALEEEKVVRDLLTQTQARAQNVVLGVKSQAAQNRTESTVLDQGLVDSLLANDAYNFLVRRALDQGLRVKQIQAEKNRLLDLRDNMKLFVESAARDQTTITAEVQSSVKKLATNYNRLIDNIRKTHADYVGQEFGDAIRLSDQIRTPGLLKPMAIAAVVGGALGFALGTGLSLLGVYIGKPRAA